MRANLGSACPSKRCSELKKQTVSCEIKFAVQLIFEMCVQYACMRHFFERVMSDCTLAYFSTFFVPKMAQNCYSLRLFKGVFSKPSGNCIVAPIFCFLILQFTKNSKGGPFIKCLISMSSNLAETLHSSAKSKNKQIAKI